MLIIKDPGCKFINLLRASSLFYSFYNPYLNYLFLSYTHKFSNKQAKFQRFWSLWPAFKWFLISFRQYFVQAYQWPKLGTNISYRKPDTSRIFYEVIFACGSFLSRTNKAQLMYRQAQILANRPLIWCFHSFQVFYKSFVCSFTLANWCFYS